MTKDKEYSRPLSRGELSLRDLISEAATCIGIDPGPDQSSDPDELPADDEPDTKPGDGGNDAS